MAKICTVCGAPLKDGVKFCEFCGSPVPADPVLTQGRNVLKTAAMVLGGLFACELHETCLEEAQRRLVDAGLHDVRIIDDLAGKHRHIVAVV